MITISIMSYFQFRGKLVPRWNTIPYCLALVYLSPNSLRSANIEIFRYFKCPMVELTESVALVKK